MKKTDWSSVPEFFDFLWKVYTGMNPGTQKIHDMIAQREELIVNDHIALRTFNLFPIDLEVLAAPFIKLGYRHMADYDIPEKKLMARHFEHPNPTYPLVFISELLVEKLSPELQRIIRELVAQVNPLMTEERDFVGSGCPWELSYATYEKLKEESEYAAWLAAWGFVPNHFTVSINELEIFEAIDELNTFLKSRYVELNQVGGEIKGSPEDYLEQSSTLAFNAPCQFSDGEHVIPGCYYEFAMRYIQPNGQMFRGFVAESANMIFESTDKGQDR